MIRTKILATMGPACSDADTLYRLFEAGCDVCRLNFSHGDLGTHLLTLRNIREADYVFRWGGDEFLVLITCTEEEAQRRATALQEAFASSPHRAGLPPGVALSVGCVEVPPDAEDIMPLIQAADERMYADKKRRGAARKRS